MTSPDANVLDLTALDRLDLGDAPPHHGDLRMMRLVLDLQLDAVLLMLGAAAHAQHRGETEGRTPWKRWLEEDLELVRTLAVALVEGDGPLVPGLGSGSTHASLERSLDNLTVRVESMENLLVTVLDSPAPGEFGRSGAGSRGAAGEVLRRCRTRLAELYRHRREAIAEAAGLPSPSLPGEWLG